MVEEEDGGNINPTMIIDGGVDDIHASSCSSDSNQPANGLTDIRTMDPTPSSLSPNSNPETDVFVSLDVEAERLLTFNDIEANK